MTPGGRLPRAFVREVQELYPSWNSVGTARVHRRGPTAAGCPARSVAPRWAPPLAQGNPRSHSGRRRRPRGDPTAEVVVQPWRRLRAHSRQRRPRQPRRRRPLADPTSWPPGYYPCLAIVGSPAKDRGWMRVGSVRSCTDCSPFWWGSTSFRATREHGPQVLPRSGCCRGRRRWPTYGQDGTRRRKGPASGQGHQERFPAL